MLTDARNSFGKGALTHVTALLQVLLLALVVLFVAGCAQAQGPPSAEKEQPLKQPSEQATEKKPEPASDEMEHPALGEKGAPVVMVEYSDYQ